MRFLGVFALVALVELAIFLWVESEIGIGWALTLALVTAVVGSYLVRRSGAAVWRRLRSRAAEGKVPGRELSDGAAVLVAGALLISPGFITDIIGFALLVPAVRSVLYQQVATRLVGRVQVFRRDSEIIDVDPFD